MTTNPSTAGGGQPSAAPTDPPRPTVFARLLAELEALDFTPSITTDRDRGIYTVIDSPVRVELHEATQPPRIHLAHTSPDEPTQWEITLTADTPDPVQLAILYAAVNSDADPRTMATAVATALDAEPAAGSGPNTPAAG